MKHKLQFAEADDSDVMREAHLVDENIKDVFLVKRTYEVEIIRIAEYIQQVIGRRKIPNGRRGVVVMKLDVEVSEIGNICIGRI